MTDYKTQIALLAKPLVNGRLSGAEFSKKKNELDRIIARILSAMGTDLPEWERSRAEKNQRHGQFYCGYVLSEKVLPIGVRAENHKYRRDDARDVKSQAEGKLAPLDECGLRPIPEKLVRDRIPEICSNQAQKNYDYLCRQIAKTEKISLRETRERNHPLKNYQVKVRIAKGTRVSHFPDRHLGGVPSGHRPRSASHTSEVFLTDVRNS